MRRLFRWAFRFILALIVLVVIAVVAAILLADTIAREILVSRLRSQTGMEVKISAVHIGLLTPTLSIEGLKLYNTAQYGGSVCLDMPELHLEYDPAALRARRLHITLLRLELADLSVVLNKSGRNNFETFKKKSQETSARKKTADKMKFTGIDVLNVTLGKFRVNNQATGRGQEIDFGVKNQILRNVKSESDLASLGLTTLSNGKANSPKGDTNLDLGQMLDSLFKGP